MNSEIVIDLIMVSMITSVIASQLTQKIKEIFNFGSVFNKIIALIISLWIGVIYTYSFYMDNLLYAIWIGIFTMIGSDNFYKMLNDKLDFGILSKNKKE